MINIGHTVIYKNQSATVTRQAFPRHGNDRVVIKRAADGRSFTVAVKYLRPAQQK